MLIADKAFDADARVLEPLAAAGKNAVIPPRANRSSLRDQLHCNRIVSMCWQWQVLGGDCPSAPARRGAALTWIGCLVLWLTQPLAP